MGKESGRRRTGNERPFFPIERAKSEGARPATSTSRERSKGKKRGGSSRGSPFRKGVPRRKRRAVTVPRRLQERAVQARRNSGGRRRRPPRPSPHLHGCHSRSRSSSAPSRSRCSRSPAAQAAHPRRSGTRRGGAGAARSVRRSSGGRVERLSKAKTREAEAGASVRGPAGWWADPPSYPPALASGSPAVDRPSAQVIGVGRTAFVGKIPVGATERSHLARTPCCELGSFCNPVVARDFR